MFGPLISHSHQPLIFTNDCLLLARPICPSARPAVCLPSLCCSPTDTLTHVYFQDVDKVAAGGGGVGGRGASLLPSLDMSTHVEGEKRTIMGSDLDPDLEQVDSPRMSAVIKTHTFVVDTSLVKSNTTQLEELLRPTDGLLIAPCGLVALLRGCAW